MRLFQSEAEALEAAIHANPYDVAVLSAYADFLTEQGDPRGEFMQVQIALEDESLPKSERERLAKRETELFKEHRKEWVGEWPPHATYKPIEDVYDPTGANGFRFERGLLTHVFALSLNLQSVRGLLADQNTKFAHHLFVRHIAFEEDITEEYEEWLGQTLPDDCYGNCAQFALLQWPQLQHIRHFAWGEPSEEQQEYYRCDIDGSRVYDFVKQMPHIEELHLYAHMREHMQQLVTLPMPNLRVLVLYHGWDYPLDKLAANPSLTKLTHLYCHPHGLEARDDPYIRLMHLQALCQSPYLISLTHLRLRMASFGDDGVREIVQSGLLKRLKVLDLQYGAVTDVGAATFAESPDIKHLELLRLSGNALTSAGVERLRGLSVNIEAEGMHDGNPHDYLYQGDAE